MTLQKIKIKINIEYNKNKNIQICWVPAHIGLKGNEWADTLAKEIRNQTPTYQNVPMIDYTSLIKQNHKKLWLEEWLKRPMSNKLRQIKEDVNKWPSSQQPKREVEVILTRLRIGHSRITHGYLMSSPKEDHPECETCKELLTIKHILIKCKKFSQERRKYLNNLTMKEILGENPNFDINRIIKYLKSIEMYDKI